MSFRYAANNSSGEDSIPLASTSKLKAPSTHLPDLPKVSLSNNNQQLSKFNRKKSVEIVVIDDEEEEEEEVEIEEEDERKGDTRAEENEDELEEEQEALTKLTTEIKEVDDQINQLRLLKNTLVYDQSALLNSINKRKKSKQTISSTSKPLIPKRSIDYINGKFPWTNKIKELAKEIWGINSFRLCQEAVLNASLDSQDIICVLRTGGGKSILYQLPALLSPGITIVITPLISLMQDQVYNLREKGINVEMLFAGTSSNESKDIHARMISGLEVKGKGKKAVKDEDSNTNEGIKLVYVTPERIEKSKTFVSVLQKLYDNNMLARFVVDEVHAISSFGHDFRPSYRQLSRLRTLFPKTKFIGVTATAPSSVIVDIIKNLQMPNKISSGNSVLPNTTVVFTSPLYRSNLHYSVISKPTQAAAVIDVIVDYINRNHSGDCGIIYCLSRSDSENVARGIVELSKGKIKCSVYHAAVDDNEKINIHKRWREGNLQVIVATNAFGLGIDAPNVRFVIHHSMAKSLESYYQESGRAGRDGLDSDCLILYRSADASRLSTLTYADFASGGKEKLYGQVNYCEDVKTCRKITFANYFASTHESKAAFEEGDEVDEVCGHCDNCSRDPDSFEQVDTSLQVYRTLKILSAAFSNNTQPTLTLTQTCDLVRGLGGGKFSTQEARGKAKAEGHVNVQQVAGSKVTLSKEVTESMIIRLLIKGYLRESFHATAYTTISYLVLTNLSTRFTRFSPEQFDSLEESPETIYLDLPVENKKKKRKSSTSNASGGDESKVVKKQRVNKKPVESRDKVKKPRKVPKAFKEQEEEVGEEEENEFDEDEYRIQQAEAEFEDYGENDDGSDEVGLDEDGWQVFKAKDSPIPVGSSSKGVAVGGKGKGKEIEMLEIEDSE